MYHNCQKRTQRVPELRRIVQPGRTSLATTILIILAVLSLTPCLGQTNVSETTASDPAEKNLRSILSTKDAAITRADEQYAKDLDAAEKSYEQLLLKARTTWSEKVANARTTAVTDLKAMSASLAADGRLAETVTALKAIYALTPLDNEAAEALAATGVDLESIPTEPDYFARRDGEQTSRIVIWNTHNGQFNTSGTLQCNVVLFQAGRPVRRFEEVDLPWERNSDTYTIVDVPSTQFDTVRVEITKWYGYAGGLAEIEIWQNGKNVAFNRPTRSSDALDGQTTSARVTDGVTTSAAYKDGYWLLPDNKAGWIEIRLARPAYDKLLRAKVSAREPWIKTLKVAPGDIVDITADGKWWASSEIVAGPDGGLMPGQDQWGDFRDRFYLQGRLAGEVFKVGSQFTLRVAEAGEIELGMNEENAGWFENNAGFLDAVLSIRKRPPLLTSSPTPTDMETADADLGVADAR